MAHAGFQVRAGARPAKEDNKLQVGDRAAHDWYRFVLSFPPHLVRCYIERFGANARQRVLDPFCGTGTTLVECKKLGISSVGIDANPMASFASHVKTNWSVNPAFLLDHANRVAEITIDRLEKEGFQDGRDLPLFRRTKPDRSVLLTLSAPTLKLLLKESISPLPLHKTLLLIDTLEKHRDSGLDSHERLAMAKSLILDIGNLHFGPEVGVGKPKLDAPVVRSWLKNIHAMAEDLDGLKGNSGTPAIVYPCDSREMGRVLEPNSVDMVITSPPYPNEKDYTRTTRLESVLLGFIESKEELRSLKRGLVRSNTRGVYKGDRDDEYVSRNRKIQRIAAAIERRRIELQKTSGFERLYARVTKLYFGGMTRHLSDLQGFLRPGALLAYVVGDQASYLRVMIRTGQILAEIADSLGYEVVGIDLFRTRLSTATGRQLREEVVVLRWPGRKRKIVRLIP